MKPLTLIIILLLAITLTTAGDLILTKEAPITIEPSKELDAVLTANKIKNITIIGADCGNAICYRLEGDMQGDLIKIPKTITNRYYSRAITKKETDTILKKAMDKRLKTMLPKATPIKTDIDERAIIIKTAKE